MKMQVFDYIIVGSGSAGSAMAYRLGEAGTKKILVLEFGGSDIGPLVQMPAALSYPMNMSRYDWGYIAEPEEGLGGRQLVCPRGKVIGGSSSINGMIQTRALPLNMLRRSVIRVYDSTTLLRGMKSTSSRKFLYQITVQQVFLLFNGIKFGMPITAPLKSGFSIQTRNQLEKLSVKTNTQPQDSLL